jgi:bis(5'-nucleosyl)-tetraphosphatase (symmetrical)
MSTFAIGDVHGCVQSFRKLLRVIGFHPSRDRLWLTGDLVNRGPDSLGVLYDVMQLGTSAQVVLGNHDLHALALAFGIGKARRGDTLEALLRDPNCMTLMGWLRKQPLMVAQGEYAMVHAGILPSWDAADVRRLAQGPQARLGGALHECKAFLEALAPAYNGPWRDDFDAEMRDVVVTKVLSYLRICDAQGQPRLDFTQGQSAIPQGCTPWFCAPSRKVDPTTWIYGHWSQWGLHQAHNLYGLDTGCVWGHKLTALRLEDKTLFSVDALEPAATP